MAAPEQRDVRYYFDGFCLDLGRGTLLGPNGESVSLRPRVFALLHHLLEHPGLLMEREALLEALWPGLVVTDDSLTQCISGLRRALGDRASHVLRTVSRRGYVLTAEVRRQEAAPEPPPAALPPAAAPATITRAGLLLRRFEAAEGAAAEQRLAGVLSTDLLAELVRFEELRVVTSGPLDGDASYGVRGEVRDAGGELRVSVLLDSLASGDILSVERFEQPVAEAGALPPALIATLAARIELQIGRDGLHRARHKPDAELTVRDLCLLGRDLHQHGTEADTRAAQALFLRAAVLDPDCAVALAWQAFTVMRTVTHGWGVTDGEAERELALQLARRAVEIEPQSPLCLSAFAFALALCGLWEEAVEMARVSLRTGRPADYGTRTSCGEILAAAGHPEEAIEAVRRAIALDPLCPPRARAVLGRALLLAGQQEEALVELRRSAAMLPDYAPCQRSMLVAAVETGRMEEARQALRAITRLQPNWLPGDRPVLWFFRHSEDTDRFLAAFRAAGWPEAGRGQAAKGLATQGLTRR